MDEDKKRQIRLEVNQKNLDAIIENQKFVTNMVQTMKNVQTDQNKVFADLHQKVMELERRINDLATMVAASRGSGRT